jgi:hypothetical protein
MGKEDSRRLGLTRSLIAGVSLGTIALVQVGCATPAGQTGASGQVAALAPASGTEEQLCERVLATSDHRDVEALLRTYPNGRCVPATLSALPPQTLTQISPVALAGLPRSSVNRIAPDARVHLRLPGSGAKAGGGGLGSSS